MNPLEIKVYGPGCKRCAGAEAIVREVAAKLSIEVEIEKISDFAQIAMAGVVSTPAISVAGTLVHSGSVPKAKDVEAWLRV
jgi:small redox-active disulfide protein 2